MGGQSPETLAGIAWRKEARGALGRRGKAARLHAELGQEAPHLSLVGSEQFSGYLRWMMVPSRSCRTPCCCV